MAFENVRAIRRAQHLSLVFLHLGDESSPLQRPYLLLPFCLMFSSHTAEGVPVVNHTKQTKVSLVTTNTLHPCSEKGWWGGGGNQLRLVIWLIISESHNTQNMHLETLSIWYVCVCVCVCVCV